jgi:hypothetical protein
MSYSDLVLDMVNAGRETPGLDNFAPGDHQMSLLDSNGVGFSLPQLMLLRAAIDGDLRLFKGKRLVFL